jgi:hypothetical protein
VVTGVVAPVVTQLVVQVIPGTLALVDNVAGQAVAITLTESYVCYPAPEAPLISVDCACAFQTVLSPMLPSTSSELV